MSQRFRRTLGGFHRDDVIAYVQKLTQDHQAECCRLREELERVKRELEVLQATASAETAPQETAHQYEVVQEAAKEMPETPDDSVLRYF